MLKGIGLATLIQRAERASMTSRQASTPDLSLSNQDFITHAVPEWLIKAFARQRLEKQVNAFDQLPWFQGLTSEQRQTLKRYTRTSLQSQQAVDGRMANVPAVEAFAKPLLVKALKDRFKVELDVDDTFIKLEKSVKLGVFDLKVGEFNVLNVSLLHAALHNFEADEGGADFYDEASKFVTKDGAPVSSSLTIEQFINLCRSLDIGAQYQAYLKDNLGTEEAHVDTVLREAIITSQKDAMKAAAYMALVKKDIEADDYAMVLQVINGERNPTLRGKPVWFSSLSVMGLKLKGCVSFELTEKYRYGEVSIVYVPHDPEHPFKRYNRFDDLKKELTRQLLATDPAQVTAATGPQPTRYQRFFSQFVDAAKHPYYFSRFTRAESNATSMLSTVVKSPVFQSVFDVTNPLASMLLKPQEWPPEKTATRQTDAGAELQPMVVARHGLWSANVDLWTDLYESGRDKIITDARHQAVPTADVDARVRAQKLAHWLEGGFAAVGLLSMFVPVLGEVMMAVMVEQLLYETFEGVMEWEQGDREAARQHLIDVAQNLAMLGLMAGVGKGLAKLPKVETPPLIDELQPVKLPNGEQSLWKPDLVPYRSDVKLPAESVPDELGLHRHDGQHILPLDGGNHVVEQNPVSGEYQIPHPTRADGYAVPLEHNGAGIWTHGAEDPLTWDGPTLMQRLGYRAQALSDAQLERVRTACGADYDTLRRQYVEQDRPSAQLSDTLSRFRIEHDLETFAQQIASDDPRVFAQADLGLQFKIMRSQGLLPQKPAWRVLDSRMKVIWEDPPGPQGSSQRVTFVVSEDTRTQGSLLESMLVLFKANRVDMSSVPGTSQMSVAERARAWRKEIAADAQHNRLTLFESLYDAQNTAADPLIGRVKARYRHLPDAVVEQLLEHATEAELEALGRPGELPPRIDQWAQWCQQELRLTRAYEGLHLDISAGVDSERLALRSLETLPGWPAQARFELREGGPQGRLLDSIGDAQSPVRGVLSVNDGSGFAQDGAGSLYCAVLSYLSPEERQALGFTLRDGLRMKQAVEQAPLPRDDLRSVLHEQRVLKPDLAPGSRLIGGMPLRQQLASLLRTPRGRIIKLYPDFTEGEADAFLQNLGGSPRNELSRLEGEFATLKQELSAWVQEPASQPGDHRWKIAERQAIALKLQRCWQRRSGTTLNLQLARELPPLNASFNHIEELVLDGSTFKDRAGGFLKRFTRLKRLRIKVAFFSRIPEAVADMKELAHLDLSDCLIPMSARDIALLEGLSTLQTLNLQRNVLMGRVLDFSGLRQLQSLNLSDTGISQWPTGLVEQPNLQLVDLRNNQLREVPPAILNPAPEQLEAQARINRVTLLQGNPFSLDGYQQLKAYSQRLTDTRPELLVGGQPGAFEVLDPLATRVRDLYPEFDDEQVQAFLQPLEQAEAEAKLAALEQEYERLNSQLSSWAFSGVGESQRYRALRRVVQADAAQEHRYQAMGRILRCWRRETAQQLASDGTPIGLELNLSELRLPSLPDLDADFSHVGSLKLRKMELSSSPDGFLTRFRHVRWLDMAGNQLTRLPQALEHMNGLTRLNLSFNRIRLTAETARVLSERTTLRVLSLQNNPLGMAPDFSAITDMRGLALGNTQLEAWPVGLFEQPSLDWVVLDNNRITTIPDSVVAPSAENLERIARTNNVTSLANNPLSEATQQRLNDYWDRLEREHPDLARNRAESGFRFYSVGAGVPTRPNPQVSMQILRWTVDLPADQLATREAQWSALARHEKADGFFNLLAGLENAGAGEEDLQQRVWAVIDTITQDSVKSEALREQMFEWAGRPACCDRASLSFSNLEIMSLVYRAESQAEQGQQAAQLLKLARGLFRLDEVEKMALTDIERRTAAIRSTPGLTLLEQDARIALLEEVEIRLAYRYGLKDRLKLPAAPSQARFIQLGQVTAPMLNQAYDAVIALDNSPAEFQALLARDFWKDYVTNTYRPQFEAKRKPFDVHQASLHDRSSSGELSGSAYTEQADTLAAQWQIEESELIETLSRELLEKHPL